MAYIIPNDGILSLERSQIENLGINLGPIAVQRFANKPIEFREFFENMEHLSPTQIIGILIDGLNLKQVSDPKFYTTTVVDMVKLQELNLTNKVAFGKAKELDSFETKTKKEAPTLLNKPLSKKEHTSSGERTPFQYLTQVQRTGLPGIVTKRKKASNSTERLSKKTKKKRR